MRCDMFVRCGAQCEAFYSCAHSGRNESLSNHKVTSTTLVHLRWQLHLRKMRRLGSPSSPALDNAFTTRIHMWRQLQQLKSLSSLLALDNQLLAPVKSHSWRSNAARPSSLAICSAFFRQSSVRRANLASCFRSVFGGPFAKKSRSGARKSKRSSSFVARDNITYRSSHQSSSSFL